MRGVGWEKDTVVHIRRSSPPIAEGPTGCGPRPAPGRGRPARRLGVGSPSPPPRRERRAPETGAPVAQGGEAEVEGEAQPGAEEGVRVEEAMEE